MLDKVEWPEADEEISQADDDTEREQDSSIH
jgi:hypothetical protein